MSWLSFSDLAKTAFNEAQKRIDKVLDIQEDGSASDGKPPIETLTDSTSKTATNTAAFDGKHSSLSVRKQQNNACKKRGKPSKLGSSLTKIQTTPIQKALNSSVVKVSPKPVDLSPDDFTEVSLENDADISNQLDANRKSVGSGDGKSSQKCDADSEIKNNSVAMENMESNYQAGHESTPAIKMPLHKQGMAGQFRPVQNVAEDLNSPSGSTTASSDIDILEQESSLSEASFAPKMTEFENHNHLMGVDGNYHARMSPDRIDSEASDIVRISGYCSSPLSVDGYDNLGLFKPRAKTETLRHPSDAPTITTDEARESQFIAVASDNLLESETNSDKLSVTSDEATSNDRTHCDDALNDSQSSTIDVGKLPSDVLSSQEGHNCSLSAEARLGERVSSGESSLHSSKTQIEQNVILSDSSSSFNVQQTDVVTEDVLVVADEIADDLKPASAEADQVSERPSDEVDAPDAQEETAQAGPSPEANTGVSDWLEMQRKFEAYEQQLVTLSVSNAQLREENDNLRSEVTNANASALNSFDEERQEFLKTIEDLNCQLQKLEVEKIEMSNELLTSKADLSQRLTNEQVQQLIAEKEESIQGLLEEGETLSKQHLQQNNLIKKLRTKAVEREQSIASLTEKLNKFEVENKAVKEKLSEMKGRSSEDRGTAERLTEAYEEREMRISELASQLEDSEEKRRAAQATLDAAYKDLAEMNKSQVALQSERANELAKREEVATKKMQLEIEKLTQEHEHEKHMLHFQMAELRDNVERTEALSTRKEDQWRKEVQDLQQRLQDSELRNHELSDSISESTRPLLRQMENLQATHSAQSKTWDALEKSLTSRLSEAHTQLIGAQDKERAAQMTCVDLKSRLTSSGQQLAQVRKENANLADEVSTLKNSASEFDAKLISVTNNLGRLERTHEESMSKARKDRLTLENQLDMEKVRADVERKKHQAQLEAMQKEKEKLMWMSRSESITSSASALNTDVESVASSSDTFNQIDAFERQFSAPGTSSGVYDSVRTAVSGSTLLENLQSQLKQRDGEIAQLQGEINTLERTRSSMAEEIVRLTNVNEDLETTASKVENLQIQLKEVKGRHDAALTMYGEKAEEAEELRLDLVDVKAMYRQQIDALLNAGAAS